MICICVENFPIQLEHFVIEFMFYGQNDSDLNFNQILQVVYSLLCNLPAALFP